MLLIDTKRFTPVLIVFAELAYSQLNIVSIGVATFALTAFCALNNILQSLQRLDSLAVASFLAASIRSPHEPA